MFYLYYISLYCTQELAGFGIAVSGMRCFAEHTVVLTIKHGAMQMGWFWSSQPRQCPTMGGDEGFLTPLEF